MAPRKKILSEHQLGLAAEYTARIAERLEAWVSECLSTDDPCATIRAREGYQQYREWSDRKGLGAVSVRIWGEFMVKRYLRVTANGGRIYRGVRLSDHQVKRVPVRELAPVEEEPEAEI